MVLLNLYRSKFSVITVLLCIVVESASAGSIPFFNPLDKMKYANNFSLKANVLLANDPFTLKDLLFNELKGNLNAKSGTNVALAVGRFDAGYGDDKYGYIGYTYREEIFMEASYDTVELIYLASNKKDLPIGKYYDLYLKLKAYEMQGLTYANKFTLYSNGIWDLDFGFGLEALYATDMQDGYVQGNATATSSKSYDFTGVSEYKYTHNYLYDLETRPSYAYGYSSHIAIALTGKNYSMLFLANDIFAKLYWQQVPYSDVYISSNNKVYDEDGYIKYNPLLSGKEGYIDYVQSLMAKYRVQGSYYSSYKTDFKLGSDYMEGYYLPYFGFLYHYDKNADVGLEYNTRFKSIILDARYEKFTIKLESNDLFSPSVLQFAVGVVF
jgi:hypothetical protein